MNIITPKIVKILGVKMGDEAHKDVYDSIKTDLGQMAIYAARDMGLLELTENKLSVEVLYNPLDLDDIQIKANEPLNIDYGKFIIMFLHLKQTIGILWGKKI